MKPLIANISIKREHNSYVYKLSITVKRMPCFTGAEVGTASNCNLPMFVDLAMGTSFRFYIKHEEDTGEFVYNLEIPRRPIKHPKTEVIYLPSKRVAESVIRDLIDTLETLMMVAGYGNVTVYNEETGDLFIY